MFVEDFTWTTVDVLAGEACLALAAHREGGAFREVLPEQSVDVFDGTFLPTGVTVRVVEGAVKALFKELKIEEFGSVVAGDGKDLEVFE